MSRFTEGLRHGRVHHLPNHQQRGQGQGPGAGGVPKGPPQPEADVEVKPYLAPQPAWRLPVEGGEPARTALPSFYRNVRVHPDGRRVGLTSWTIRPRCGPWKTFCPDPNTNRTPSLRAPSPAPDRPAGLQHAP